MVEIRVTYDGELHTTAHHEPSGSVLATDAPVDNQGRGQAFSPTDLLATALATCMLTTIAIVARREGWAIEGAAARVEKHMQGDPRRVGRIRVDLALPGGLPQVARERLEEAARGCPVARSLDVDLECDLRMDWGAIP